MDAAIQLSLIEQAAAAKVQQRKNVRFAAKLSAAPQDPQKQPRGTYLLCTSSSTSSEVSTSGCVLPAPHTHPLQLKSGSMQQVLRRACQKRQQPLRGVPLRVQA